MNKNDITESRLKEKVQDELTPVELEGLYKDWLDDTYGGINIEKKDFNASEVLEELSWRAYDRGMEKFASEHGYIEVDGEWYDEQAVDELREEVENELSESEEDSN